MYPTYYILIAVLLIFFMIGRFITSGAAKLLTDEYKALLVDFSVQQRRLTIPVTIIGIGAIFIKTQFAFIFFLLILIGINWYQQWKFKSMGFPKDYRNRILIGSVITLAGIGVPILGTFIVSFLNH